MADAITGDNDKGSLGRLSSQYTGKMREYWLKYETVLFDIVMKRHF